MSRTTRYLLSIPLFLTVSFAVGFLFQTTALESLATALFGVGMMTAWMFFPNGGENIQENMIFIKQNRTNKIKIILKNFVYLGILIFILMGGVVAMSHLLKLNVGHSVELMRPLIMFVAGVYIGLAMQKHGLGGQIPATE